MTPNNRLIARSRFPRTSSLSAIGIASACLSASIVSLLTETFVIGGVVFGLFGLAWFAGEARLRWRWRCPRCRKRDLRIVSVGGMYFASRGEIMETRVEHGECQSCGATAVRPMHVLAKWQDAENFGILAPRKDFGLCSVTTKYSAFDSSAAGH
jgi:hypothetical protein